MVIKTKPATLEKDKKFIIRGNGIKKNENDNSKANIKPAEKNQQSKSEGA